MDGTTMVLRISSRYHCAFKLPSINAIIRSLCLPITPQPPCSQHWHQQTACPHNTIHVVCGCEASWKYHQNLEWHLVEKFTFNYLATSLVDIPVVSMAIACSLNLRHLRCVTKLCIVLEWPFIVPRPFTMRFEILLRCFLFLLIILEMFLQLDWRPPVVN